MSDYTFLKQYEVRQQEAIRTAAAQRLVRSLPRRPRPSLRSLTARLLGRLRRSGDGAAPRPARRAGTSAHRPDPRIRPTHA